MCQKTPFVYPTLVATLAILLVSCGIDRSRHAFPARQAAKMMSSTQQKLLEHMTPRYKNIVSIGRRAAALERYPTSLDKPKKLADVAELLDRAFLRLELTGVQLDLRTNPDDQEGAVFIVHDEVDWDDVTVPQQRYLGRNRLDQVLEHYAEQRLHNNHRLYLVLTEQDEEDGALLARRTLEAIEEGIGGKAEAGEVMKTISFASYNRRALAAVVKAWKKRSSEKMPFKLYLMVSSNRWYCKLASPFLSHPCMDGAVEEFISHTPWLNGVWFAPTRIKDSAEVFNDLNIERQKKKLKKIGFGIFVYADEYDKLIEEVSESEVKLNDLDSLIYDVTDKTTPAD